MKNIFISKSGKIFDISEVTSVLPNEYDTNHNSHTYIMLKNGEKIDISYEDYEYLGKILMDKCAYYCGWIPKEWKPKQHKSKTTQPKQTYNKMFM